MSTIAERKTNVEPTTFGFNPVLKYAGYLLLLITTGFGLWAIGVTFSEGHIHSATTQHVPWGLWVALYIYFLGLSAGSFLLSTMIYVFKLKYLEESGPLALVQALLCLFFGGFLILIDLGHPGRIINVFTSFNANSVMSWMGTFYCLYFLVVLVELYFAFRAKMIEGINSGKGPLWVYRILTLGNRDLSPASLLRDSMWLRNLSILGIPIAIIVHGGVGMIFGVAKARPTWYGGLFPIIFLISALASGAALLTFLVAAFQKMPADKKQELVSALSRLTLGILTFEWLLILSEVLTKLYGGMPAETNAWLQVLSGPYSWVFWVVQFGLGFVVPLIIVSHPATGKKVSWLGFTGFLVAIGMIGTRLNIVIPAQITPVFENSVEAYYHLRNSEGYFPSNIEFLVALGVFSLAIWLFILAFNLLPIKTTVQESIPQGESRS